MIPADTPFWLAFVIVSALMTAMVAIRYFMASGMFAWLTRLMRPGLYEGQSKQIRMEIRYSLISTFIYGAPAGIVFWLWRHHDYALLYTDWAEYPLWYLPLSVVLYLFVQDSWFYWSHRAMHHWPKLFTIAHAVHHKSKPPTAWTAMSFHPIEAVSGAIVIPLLVFVLPIHLAMLGIVLSIATVMGVINHMGWEIMPRRFVHSALGEWLITASHHEKHHEDYRCNFGLYFRFWDRMCGTDRGLSTRLDTPKEASA